MVKEEKKAKRGVKKVENEAEKVVKKTRKPRAKKPAAPKAITPNDIA